MTIKKRFGSSNCEDRCDCLFALPRYQARVEVQLRPSVLDPAGEATRSAAARLGELKDSRALRIGKAIVLSLEAADAKQAEAQVGVLCDRLLGESCDGKLEHQPGGTPSVTVGIVVFPGSNCDRDMAWALSGILDLPCRFPLA